MIECKKCKEQYISETKRTLRERFSEHRQATSNPIHANAAAAVPSHSQSTWPLYHRHGSYPT